MQHRITLGRGIAGPALLPQVAAVLDPLAIAHAGQPTEVITPILRRAWRRAFDTELPQPVLTRCARAIAEGTPWTEELFPTGWYRPEASKPSRRLPASGTDAYRHRGVVQDYAAPLTPPRSEGPA